jgi:hypothetical protein
MPVEKLERGNWPHPARLPLGGGWLGHCTAPGHEGEQPPQHILEAFCNLGYAGSCAWSPLERACDAVRFAVSAPAEMTKRGAPNRNPDAPARVLTLHYVRERNHLPVEHGDLEYDLAQTTWLRTHSDPRIQRMAECFLDSYLKKKS